MRNGGASASKPVRLFSIWGCFLPSAYRGKSSVREMETDWRFQSDGRAFRDDTRTGFCMRRSTIMCQKANLNMLAVKAGPDTPSHACFSRSQLKIRLDLRRVPRLFWEHHRLSPYSEEGKKPGGKAQFFLGLTIYWSSGKLDRKRQYLELIDLLNHRIVTAP